MKIKELGLGLPHMDTLVPWPAEVDIGRWLGWQCHSSLETSSTSEYPSVDTLHNAVNFLSEGYSVANFSNFENMDFVLSDF